MLLAEPSTPARMDAQDVVDFRTGQIPDRPDFRTRQQLVGELHPAIRILPALPGTHLGAARYYVRDDARHDRRSPPPSSHFRNQNGA